MWIAVVAVVVVAVGAVVARLTWRSNADESHSVRNHQSALGTMEHLADRPSVRVLGTPDEASTPTGSPSVHVQDRLGPPRVPPVPVREDDGFPDPRGPIVFDDARPSDRYRRSPEAAADGFRSERARRQALESMNHRPRRLTITVVVVVLVAGFGVLAVVGSHRSNHRPTSTATTAPTVGHPGTTQPSATSVVRPKKSPRTTTTTTTTPTQIVAVTSTASAATYSTGDTAYVVSLTATGACWVDATNRATGTTVFAGTMTAGTNQVLRTTGTMTVDLGTPTVSMTLNGIPVVLPTPLQSPFVATFSPVAATSATSATAPSTTVVTTTTAAP